MEFLLNVLVYTVAIILQTYLVSKNIKSKIQSLHKGESNDLTDKGWNEAIEHITKNIL